MFTRYTRHRLTEEAIKAKAHLILGVYSKLGACCLVPGERDMALGTDVLKQVARDEHITLLAANIVTIDGGKPAFKASLLKKVGSTNIGIIGIVGKKAGYDSEMLSKAGLKITDPSQAAKREAAVLKSKGAKLILAISHLGFGEEDMVLKSAPDITFLLGSHQGRRLTRKIERPGAGPAWVADAGVRGQYMGRIDLYPAANGEPFKHLEDGGVEGRLKKEIARQEKTLEREKARLNSQGDVKKSMEQEKRRRTARIESLERRISSLEKELPGLKKDRTKSALFARKSTYLKRYKEQIQSLKKAPFPTEEETKKRIEIRRNSIKQSIDRMTKRLNEKKKELNKLKPNDPNKAHFISKAIPLDSSVKQDQKIASKIKAFKASGIQEKAISTKPVLQRKQPLIKPVMPLHIPLEPKHPLPLIKR
ncbi:MAG: hypothetical protein GXP49_15900 [Deltaproteobacteria bacterium]|nr:hypothetical protein [Deltaproteobacteria bacterium]